MKKLNNATRVDELNDAAARIISHYGDHTIDDSKLQQVIEVELASEVQRMSNAIKKAKKLSVLAELDKKRDKCISALNNQLKGYSFAPEEEIVTSAQNVLEVFNRFGAQITKMTYSAENTQITTLLNRLKDPSLASDIAKLYHIQASIDLIEEAQDEFNKAYLEYESESSKSGVEQTATEIKPEMLNTINNKIVVRLNDGMAFEPEKYQAFASEVEEVIKTTNELTKRRMNKNKEEAAARKEAREKKKEEVEKNKEAWKRAKELADELKELKKSVRKIHIVENASEKNFESYPGIEDQIQNNKDIDKDIESSSKKAQ